MSLEFASSSQDRAALADRGGLACLAKLTKTTKTA
jgi:hypothetical protein